MGNRSRYTIRAITLLFLSAGPILSAPRQAASIPGVIFSTPSVGNGCPVSFSVQRTSPIEVVNAADAERHQGAQRIHLTIDPLHTTGIKRARIIVHAVSLKAHLLPAAGSSSSPSVDHSFEISNASAAGLREKNLWVDGVGAILSVDLASITYVDGSTWQRSQSSSCRAIPSLLLLVGDLTASPRN